MKKESYDKLIQDIKNDKSFYISQIGDLLIVKNSNNEKRVLSEYKDNWFGYWIVVDHPSYDVLSGQINGRLALSDTYARCETLEDVKRAADE